MKFWYDVVALILTVGSMIVLLLAVLLGAGCASIYHPELPGPADHVDCQINRSGSLIGTYTCTVEGNYEMKQVSLF